MPEDERLYSIRTLVFDYVKSPSLRHIRDPHFVVKLAKDILRVVDRGTGPWQKWDAAREAMLTTAAPTWISAEDLRDYFNSLPGPKFTATDVAQRLHAIQEEGFGLYPSEALKEGCAALYHRERAAGTEMPAIIGAVQESGTYLHRSKNIDLPIPTSFCSDNWTPSSPSRHNIG